MPNPAGDGDGRRGAGDKRGETGDRRQETGYKRRERDSQTSYPKNFALVVVAGGGGHCQIFKNNNW